MARKSGVKEIWGGNYGILTSEIQSKFDRVFIGYSEHEIAKEVSRDIDKILHPPIIWYYGTTFGINLSPIGILYTSRGCPYHCDFCQTPVSCKGVSKIPIDSIERILKYYNQKKT